MSEATQTAKLPENRAFYFAYNLDQKNYKQAFVYAHTLKGLAQTLGFTKLALCSGAVTEALRNDQYALAEIKLPDLTRAYNATISAIASFLK